MPKRGSYEPDGPQAGPDADLDGVEGVGGADSIDGIDAGDDDELFRSAMADVAPLQRQTAAASAPRAAPTPGQLARQQAAVAKKAAKDPNFHTWGGVDNVEPEANIAWKKDGVQHEVERKLRAGRYPVQDTLDLHRRRLKDARRDLYAFVQKSLKRGNRTVLVLHGKGADSPEPAKLKSHVAHWLPQFPEVIAFHSAIPKHGGAGAVYVMLRKSEQAKADNRELHRQKGNLDHTR